MQIKFSQFARRQQLFVFLTVSGLFVAQYQRNFAGWVCLHSANVPLSENAQDFSEIFTKLKAISADWRIPAATWVSWIMPGDVVAVLRYCKPDDQVFDIANLFPFELSDIKVSDFDQNSVKPQSLYWIHKDWLNEIVKVSTQLGWACDEIYTRAQLFKPTITSKSAKCTLLLEGDSAEKYLHIYSPEGAVVRTTKVTVAHPDDVVTAIRREVAAMPEQAGNGCRLLVCNLPAQTVDLSRLETETAQVPAVEFERLMVQLIGSLETGIEVRATYGTTVNRVNAYSLGFALIGSLMLGLMVWHDGVLQLEIDANRSQLRKETPQYQTSKALRIETLKMAQAVKVKTAIAADPPVFQPLAEIASVLPSPIRLAFYEYKATTVRIAGTNGNPAAVKTLLEKNQRFSNIRITTPPESLKGSEGKFALEMQWQESLSPTKLDQVQGVVK